MEVKSSRKWIFRNALPLFGIAFLITTALSSVCVFFDLYAAFLYVEILFFISYVVCLVIVTVKNPVSYGFAQNKISVKYKDGHMRYFLPERKDIKLLQNSGEANDDTGRIKFQHNGKTKFELRGVTDYNRVRGY
jgi:hypothetical protein